MEIHIPNHAHEFDGASKLVPEFFIHNISLRPLEGPEDFEEILPDLLATGVLHAFPFARFSGTLLVSRIFPGKSGTRGMGLLDTGYSDVITLSPDGTHWIESLICYLKLRKWAEDLSVSEIRKVVEQDQGCWTDTDVALNFMSSIHDICSRTDNYYDVRSLLWQSLGKYANSPWFSALGTIWGTHPADLPAMNDYSTLEKYYPEIIRRIAAGVYAYSCNFEKLDPLASWFITQDDVYDAGYNWHSRGIVQGDLSSQCSTMVAKAYIQKNRSIPGAVPGQQEAWEALGLQLSTYDGREHFEFAKSISGSNPELAFIYVCNASSYFSAQRRELNQVYFEFAQKLASDNNWVNLENWYQWIAGVL